MAATENPSFDDMILQHKRIIFKVANAYCSDEEGRKDLVQEIMIQLWRSYGRYNQQYKISTWMYNIALNVAISFYRKHVSQSKYVTPITDQTQQIADTAPVDKEYQLRQLELFISELKELDRALILLYLDEKSHKEMALILGISETNVATKIGRIKEKLRQRFINN